MRTGVREAGVGGVPRFDRYLLSQLMMLFGFFALVLVSVYWINTAVRLFDQIISDGQSAWVFLELTALSLPNIVRLILPVAAFVATVYVMNRLSGESELAVMQATGFSPFRLARPVLWFGLAVAVLMLALVNVLEPAARKQLADRRGEIAGNVSSRFLVQGSFVHPASGITLYIREITEQGELRDIFLHDMRDAAHPTTYTAQRAALVRSDSGPKLVMFTGMSQIYDTTTGRLSVTRFANFSYDVGALVGATGARTPTPEELGTWDLLRASAATQELTGANAARLLQEGHDRVVQPFMPLASALLGFAPLLVGGFSRFGLWRQIALAVVLLALLQLSTNVVASAALRDERAWPLTYLPVLGAFAVASGILAWAGRERRVGRPEPVAAVTA